LLFSSNPKREAKNLAELIEDVHLAAFGTEAAASDGLIRRATRDSKKDHLDKLIAAHAAFLGSVLVANNVKDFAKYPGVVLENWL
jgi:tRNA(fMet)-specific endonuclease VapC